MVKLKLFTHFLCLLSISCFSQVGINTDTPSATLDVNGNVKIRSVSTVTGADVSISNLAIDQTTKEIKALQSSTGNTHSINYVTYQFNNVKGDWIENFDTKIPTADYTVVIVGSSFSKKLKMGSPSGDFSPVNVYSFGFWSVNGEDTWRISADYQHGVTQDESNGDWTVYCLVINSTMLKRLSEITSDMNGLENGSAGSPPAGL